MYDDRRAFPSARAKMKRKTRRKINNDDDSGR
jgi:hypothetical protein